jgi:hypothetical protein
MIQLLDHICTEKLELYALNCVVQSEVGAVEEHLLLCARCQLTLQELDDEIRQIRAALNLVPERQLADMETTAPIALKWEAIEANAENLCGSQPVTAYRAKLSFRS